MEESKSGLSVWQFSLLVWLSPSVVFLSAVKFVYLAFYSFCVSAPYLSVQLSALSLY